MEGHVRGLWINGVTQTIFYTAGTQARGNMHACIGALVGTRALFSLHNTHNTHITTRINTQAQHTRLTHALGPWWEHVHCSRYTTHINTHTPNTRLTHALAHTPNTHAQHTR